MLLLPSLAMLLPAPSLFLPVLAGLLLVWPVNRAIDALPRRILQPQADAPGRPEGGALSTHRHRKRTWAIAVLMPALAVVTVQRLGLNAEGLAATVLLWTLLTAATIDLETGLLPDALTLPLLAAGLLVNGWAVLTPWQAALAGAAVGALLLWIPHRIYRVVAGKAGVGAGDFKLLAAIGAWLGWAPLVGVVFYAALLAAALGLLLLGVGRSKPQQTLPFGPMLAAATALVLWT